MCNVFTHSINPAVQLNVLNVWRRDRHWFCIELNKITKEKKSASKYWFNNEIDSKISTIQTEVNPSDKSTNCINFTKLHGSSKLARVPPWKMCVSELKFNKWNDQILKFSSKVYHFKKFLRASILAVFFSAAVVVDYLNKLHFFF